MSATLKVTNRLGMELQVPVGDNPLESARSWGAKGWRSVNIPPRGIKMPLIMADTFDWALLGAREDVIDGSAGVWFDGSFWKRRDLQANPKKNLEACVKYSRGAKKTDDSAAIEGDDDGFQYITLIIFRGGGSPIREYERTAKPSSAKPPLKGEQLADAIARGDAEQPISPELIRAIEQAQRETSASDSQVESLTARITNGKYRDFRQTSLANGRLIFEALANYRKGAA